MTNPAATRVSEDITIEILVTDGGVDYLVDTGMFTVFITFGEIYYWDFTEITVQVNGVCSQFNTSNFARMYIKTNTGLTQSDNFGS